MTRGGARAWKRFSIAMLALLGASALAEEPVTEPANPPIPVSDPAAERRVIEEVTSTSRTASVKAGTELYKAGEYPLAAQRFDEALSTNPNDEQALLFSGLAQLRLDNPEKAYTQWGRFQQQTKNRKVGDEVGRARTILLREVSERAAKEAVANELALRRQPTSPRLVAVATFKNAGTAEFEPLGKALAAMLIDNLSALPGLHVLERERVEALEQETKLEGTGLVEKGTAVRAGKLLRAGRVTAGSHADWTASPTHLKLDALLVDVDTGQTIAEGKSEAMATEFFKLVPDVATGFATRLGVDTGQLPPEAKTKLTQQHTQNLDALLAFGKMLDALDHHDLQKAAESCKLLEQMHENSDIMKKKCAYLPLEWLSVAGLAAAVDPVALAEYDHPAEKSYTVPIIAGLVGAAAIAGGTYAAVSAGGGGGGGGSSNGGNNPPQLNGVGDRTVGAGQTAGIDMDCHDPEGTASTISSAALPPGGSFEQTSGNPSTGKYRQVTNAGEVGQSFGVAFTCTDSGVPAAATSRGATIHVVAAPQPPTPVPTVQPTPVPRTCKGRLEPCSSNGQCCSGQCQPPRGQGAAAAAVDVPSNVCCVPPGGRCTQSIDCCDNNGQFFSFCNESTGICELD